MASLEELVQQPGERHLMYGGTRTGKSTFMDVSIRHVQRERPECMQLLADTKPRFRAETIAYGPNNAWRKDAAKQYEHWAKGPVLPNSVALNWNSAHPFRGMWDKRRPGEVVIMQHDNPAYWRYMNMLMHSFVSQKIKDRERLLIVDEGLDFYQRNTLGIDARNDVILRTARAGGERNIGLLLGAHRPHGIPPLLNTLSSRVTLFYLRFTRDMRYLWEMGIPEDIYPPEGNYVAKQFTINPGGTVSDPTSFILELPDSYLSQLAAS